MPGKNAWQPVTGDESKSMDLAVVGYKKQLGMTRLPSIAHSSALDGLVPEEKRGERVRASWFVVTD